MRANFKRVLAWMAEGKLPVDDLLTHRAVGGGPEPMPLGEIFEVSRWAIVMQSMQTGEIRIATEFEPLINANGR